MKKLAAVVVMLGIVFGTGCAAPVTHESDGSCDEALMKDCDAARRQGHYTCGVCIGTHQQDLHSAGCNESYIDLFCNNQTCILDTACADARAQGPFECADCIGMNEADISQTCTLAEKELFCRDNELPACEPQAIPFQAWATDMTVASADGRADHTVKIKFGGMYLFNVTDSTTGRISSYNCHGQASGSWTVDQAVEYDCNAKTPLAANITVGSKVNGKYQLYAVHDHTYYCVFDCKLCSLQ